MAERPDTRRLKKKRLTQPMSTEAKRQERQRVSEERNESGRARTRHTTARHAPPGTWTITRGIRGICLPGGNCMTRRVGQLVFLWKSESGVGSSHPYQSKATDRERRSSPMKIWLKRIPRKARELMEEESLSARVSTVERIPKQHEKKWVSALV